MEQDRNTIYNTIHYSNVTEWDYIPFEEALDKNPVKFKKLKNKEIHSEGDIPVVDQGETFISGYTNDIRNSYSGQLPVVIFGDHTRNLKYVDFNFAVGADGTKIFKVKNILLPKFFYYYLLSLNIPSYGYSRHYKFLREIKVPVPPKDIQATIIKKLDYVLSTNSENSKVINTSIKKLPLLRISILHSAVTGKLTEDWRLNNNVDQFSNFYAKTNGNTPLFNLGHFDTYEAPDSWLWKQFWEVAEIKSNLVDPSEYPTLPLIAPNNIERNTGFLIDKPLTNTINPISAKHLFESGAIVYSKIRPYLSKLVLVDFKGLCSADMYPIDTKLNPQYLLYFMLSETFLETVSNIGDRTLLPKVNQKELYSIPVCVPPIEEQEEIVRRVKLLLDLGERVSFSINEAENKSNLLIKSVLNKTFNPALDEN